MLGSQPIVLRRLRRGQAESLAISAGRELPDSARLQDEGSLGRPGASRTPELETDWALGFSDGSSRDVDLTGDLHGPVFEPLADPDFFAQVRVDDELGTVVWPNGADLDPLVLHGDFEPAPRLVHR